LCRYTAEAKKYGALLFYTHVGAVKAGPLYKLNPV
jgi:hypothetical protein